MYNNLYILNKIKEEGDNLDWVYTTSNGLSVNCFIRRSRLKFLLGYIEVSSDNKYFEKNYLDIPVTAHGGLTYSGNIIKDLIYSSNIKDIEEDEINKWYFGFDCGHYTDMCDDYKDMEYVKNECESLAEQLSKFDIAALRDCKLDKILDK